MGWPGHLPGHLIPIPPGHSDSAPQAVVLLILSGLMNSSSTPQSLRGKTRQFVPASQPPTPPGLALSALPSSLSSGSQKGSFHRGGPCRLPTCPSSSWPEDTATVPHSLQGPQEPASPGGHTSALVTVLTFSPTSMPCTCYFLCRHEPGCLSLPLRSCSPPPGSLPSPLHKADAFLFLASRPAAAQRPHASVKVLNIALESSSCLSSFSSSAVLA